MKAFAILVMAFAAVTLTSTASADNYGDMVAQGYRWADVDGLYACVSKDDVRRMANNPSDEVFLKMIEQVKAYFLTPGALVKVIEEDPQSGFSEIQMAGITEDLWTLTRFLTKHPIRDTYGVVETPATSGLIPTAATGIDVGPLPTGDFTPSPGMSPVPGMSPLPDMSPIPQMSPVPAASPTPGETPAPTPQTNQ
jgi:hypothetical protein